MSYARVKQLQVCPLQLLLQTGNLYLEQVIC